MTKVLFIGDVHGHFESYMALIEGKEASVQVGDMGLGFGKELPRLSQNHYFIRGNHDDPAECLLHPNCVSDGWYKEDWDMFFLGGAWSIDWEWRQQYESHYGRKIWWRNEECSQGKLDEIVARYKDIKPRFVVTHDCPLDAAIHLNSQHTWDTSRTRNALSEMFYNHKPEFWLFGHHHITEVWDFGGTRFICLNELDHVTLEI